MSATVNGDEIAPTQVDTDLEEDEIGQTAEEMLDQIAKESQVDEEEMRMLVSMAQDFQNRKISEMTGGNLEHEYQLDEEDLSSVCFWVHSNALSESVDPRRADQYRYHCSKIGEVDEISCGKSTVDMVPIGPTVKDSNRICKTCLSRRPEVVDMI